jgi:hypothetical protein
VEIHAADRGETTRALGTRLRARSGRLLWAVLAGLVAFYVAHQVLDLGGAGANELFDSWVNDALLWVSAGLCLAGALHERRGRAAWILVAAALASWAIGDTIWSVRYGPSGNGPLTSISDVFWLAWYPLILVALVRMVRDRVPVFELHRWIDGVAVMLLVTITWLALFLAPVHEHKHVSALADVVDFAYPLGDALVVGAILGVYALMGWRPDRMWLLLGLGLAVMGTADAVYAVQALEHTDRASATYSPAWVAGALIVAYASWHRYSGQAQPREIYGWRAVALPLVAQGLAAAVQVYGFFAEIPRSERLLTLLLLGIAMVQIVVTRPRRPPDPPGHEERRRN